MLEPREGWIMTSSMLTPHQTNRPKRALTSMCMEVTYKCRLLGLSLLLVWSTLFTCSGCTGVTATLLFYLVWERRYRCKQTNIQWLLNGVPTPLFTTTPLSVTKVLGSGHSMLYQMQHQTRILFRKAHSDIYPTGVLSSRYFWAFPRIAMILCI